jgi:hypothetical protein
MQSNMQTSKLDEATTDTQFRCWMDMLCTSDADCPDRPEWPVLLRKMLHEELVREQKIDRPYTGKRILIPRLDHPSWRDASGEKRATYGLYHKCVQESNGLLTIGTDHYWLLSYEVPNQGNDRYRRADLLGLTKEGGLRVFESKLPENGTAPLAALLEGLDYLACLTGSQNFETCLRDFDELRAGSTPIPLPDGFDSVRPMQAAQHGVIVLGPGDYFRKYSRSRRGFGWKDIAEAGRRTSYCVELSFAVSEVDSDGFFSPDVKWALDVDDS